MVDFERVRSGLTCHINRVCRVCPYSDNPKGCLIEGLLPDALALIDEQHQHIDEIHRGIEALRDAMKEDLNHG